ncbi:hypothetical protein CLCR_07252 [Cladophialophora carrionii]|uniref:Uncharacterized protein n=1 Tax=Cladophialophora carrionii TaxID=86049 RepID=A0A1C1CPN6_9EURO|nr:hypothetical protein CLCR_07252 [Cladophialophora carrionii]
MSEDRDDKLVSDDELLEIELEQRQLDLDREVKQRQLNLDRKKIEIRKRRAKRDVPVDLTLDDGAAQVKREPTESDRAKSQPNSTSCLLPCPVPNEATGTLPANNVAHEHEQLSTPGQSQQCSEPAPERNHCTRESIPRSRERVPSFTDFKQATTPLPSGTQTASYPTPSSQFFGTSDWLPRTVMSENDAVSQFTPPATYGPQSIWRENIFRGVPANTSLKRSHSPDSNAAVLAHDTNDTIEVKHSKMCMATDHKSENATNKKRTKTAPLTERQQSEIIRKYGARLVQYHMHKCDCQLPARLITEAGSKIVDGLVAKKFKSLQELHDEYESILTSSCPGNLGEVVRTELQKFRRAAPVWWAECLAKPEAQRLAFVSTVFSDVNQGKYDARYVPRPASPALGTSSYRPW